MLPAMGTKFSGKTSYVTPKLIHYHTAQILMASDMPLFMRIDAHDDYLENGLTIEEVISFCKLAGAAGVDVLDISRGNVISAGMKYEVPPVDIPKAFNIENAAKIRKETGMFTIGVEIRSEADEN